MTSQRKRRISWQLTLALAVLCFLLSLAGLLFALFSAMGEVHDTFSLSDTAAPIRSVNGLARDGEGRFYLGCGGSASIQVFDREGRFLRRLCIPACKAGSATFAWKLEGETLRIYTYRGPARLTVEGTQVTKTETYPDSAALEAAMAADGLSPNGGRRSGQGTDGSLLRLDILGRLHVTEPDGTTRSLTLEVPHFPPPFPLCWGMMLVGTGGMLLLLGRAAGLLGHLGGKERLLPSGRRPRFSLGGKKRREGLDNSRHIG